MTPAPSCYSGSSPPRRVTPGAEGGSYPLAFVIITVP
jgi:hypothetical protein